jgi:hypothetical protein
MSSNFLKIYKNTLVSFCKSIICWVLSIAFIVINILLIILLLPSFESNPKGLQTDWVELIDVLSWIPMGLIFVVIGSYIFNASDNIYILTKSTNRNQLFCSKMLAQFTLFAIFILFYVAIWLIEWNILNQRTIDDGAASFGITPNIFNFGFTPLAIIIPPLLLALCCVPLSSVAIHFSKNGINTLVGGVLALIGIIGFICTINGGLHDDSNKIYDFTLVWPSIFLSIVALIEYAGSYIYINKINIKI